MRKTTIKVRKRIENSFTQFTNQLNIMRNYAKSVGGSMTRIHTVNRARLLLYNTSAD